MAYYNVDKTSNFDTQGAILRMWLANHAGKNIAISDGIGYVENLSNLFANHTTVENIDLYNMKTNKVTDLSYAFANCLNLKSVNNFYNYYAIDNIYRIFYNSQNCTQFPMIRRGGLQNIADAFSYSGIQGIGSIAINTWSSVTNAYGVFYGCNNLTSVNLYSWKPINATNFAFAFGQCHNLTQVEINTCNFRNAINLASFFAGCSNLQNVTFYGTDLTNVESIKAMFVQCSNLTRVNFYGYGMFNNLTDMSSCFSNCYNLHTFDNNLICSFEKLANTERMFWLCYNLQNIEPLLGDAYFNNLVSAHRMFWGCKSLTSINGAKWTFNKLEDMYGMFFNCLNLKEISTTNWNLSKVTAVTQMFAYCNNLSAAALNNIGNALLTANNVTSKNLSNTNAISPFYGSNKSGSNFSSTIRSQLQTRGWTF